MIKVAKSKEAPAKLLNEGKVETDLLKKAFDEGQRQFTFKRSIYADQTVKHQLLADQNKKCCFCEAVKIKSMDVEHFRPKGQVTGAPTHPGYYWLAYDWENLLGCCSTCNSRAKNFLFPLVDSGKRAASHEDDIAQEEPLFVHPVYDEPTQHIWFNKFTALGMTDKGRRTVDKEGGLDLNHEEIIFQRKSLWMVINREITTLLLLRRAELKGHVLPEDLRQEVRKKEQNLKAACDPKQPFSAMVAIEVGRLFALTELGRPELHVQERLAEFP